MSRWEELIQKYAGDKQICNCGDAYYKNCGHAFIKKVEVFNYPTCEHGCSSNQIKAKEYIANQVLNELKTRGEK